MDQTVVLVTGATDGLGRALARELAARGATALLHGRDAAKGAVTMCEIREETGLHATYEELSSRGVEFQQEPSEQPYGIDAGFRDVSGNQMRVAQLS